MVHYRPKANPPTVVVEHPDGSMQSVPLSWTDRASPDEQMLEGVTSGCLSGHALLDLVELLRVWREGG